jgi:YegS/Rv2252/BmrU family lipid kinase
MQALGWAIDLRVTEGAGHAEQLARDAAAAGCSVVFACGGDGTLNEVVNGIVGTEAAAGVLRGGMGNVFAKEIGVPKAPEQALRCLFDGDRRRFDLGVVRPLPLTPSFLRPGSGQASTERGDLTSGGLSEETWASRYFLVMAGVGFDGAVVKKVPSRPKRWLGSTSYVLWGLRELLHYRPRQARISLDGIEQEVELYWLLLGNTRSYGGVLDITRRAVVDDGKLDAYVFGGRGLGWLAQTAARLVLRKQEGAPGVTFERVRELEVSTEGLLVQVDGEYVGETPAQFGVAPGAIEVLLPKGGGAQLFGAGD